jgi:hypothetical protein
MDPNTVQKHCGRALAMSKGRHTGGCPPNVLRAYQHFLRPHPAQAELSFCATYLAPWVVENHVQEPCQQELQTAVESLGQVSRIQQKTSHWGAHISMHHQNYLKRAAMLGDSSARESLQPSTFSPWICVGRLLETKRVQAHPYLANDKYHKST